jgi:hypothetical protein
MKGYLQLIEKLNEIDDIENQDLVAELQRIIQDLPPEDREYLREVLDGTKEPEGEELSTHFSSEDMRTNFYGFVIITYSPESGLELLREYSSMLSAMALLKALQDHYFYPGSNASDMEWERIRKQNTEIRQHAKRAIKALEEELIEPAIVPYISAYLEHGMVTDVFDELFVAQVTTRVQEENDNTRLEKVALLWDSMRPKEVRRALRRVYLDSDEATLGKVNATRLLVLLGEAQIVVVNETAKGQTIANRETAGTASPIGGMANQFQELANLYRAGDITAEEYKAAKARILGV